MKELVYSVEFMNYTNTLKTTVSDVRPEDYGGLNSLSDITYIEVGHEPFLVRESELKYYSKFGGGYRNIKQVGYIEIPDKPVEAHSYQSVLIKRNTNGDTRVADHVPTIQEFSESNEQHVKDVNAVGSLFCTELRNRLKRHDWTKLEEPYKSMFYQAMIDTINGKIEFMDSTWANAHYTELERHHLMKHVPDDVNLFDIVEMVCDCVAAGIARSGSVYPIELDKDILNDAIKNTVELLVDKIVVEE